MPAPAAGEAGEKTTFGPVTLYNFGADPPTSMLTAQLDISRQRFESLIGERLEIDRPLRLFVFGRRNSFDALFRWAFLYTSNLDGFYAPWFTATISLTTEFPAHRLADLERITRVLLTYFNLDSYRKRPSALWVQMGLANVIASGGDESESIRLNRKMLASLSRGDSFRAADLFHVNPRSLIKLMRDWQQFDNFSRYSQLVAQSTSVVEYLCCDEQRLQRFRAFLREPTKRSPVEEAFLHHHGFGFEILLEQWRRWVLDRGIGSHEPPPDGIRDALMNRVIPIVQDEAAKSAERIQAIREMGRTGYARR